MKADVWGVFHDGVIEKIEQPIPGEMHIDLKIPYLRKMFRGNGVGFKLRLLGCSKFEYVEYDGMPISTPGEIEALEPEVLYVTSTEPLVLDCAGGILSLAYEAMEVTLESGEAVSYEALVSACEKYWNDWQSRADA